VLLEKSFGKKTVICEKLHYPHKDDKVEEASSDRIAIR